LAKFWLSILTELRNRGPRDILIFCCDGLSGGRPGRWRAVESHLRETRPCPLDHGTGSRSQILIEATSTVPAKM
jgi:hypothetical protein